MSTTRKDVNDWFDEAKRRGASHMVVATDTFDHTDFPVYVSKPEDYDAVHKLYNDPTKMVRITEVYDISLPKEDQLNEHRAWHEPKIEVK